MTTSLLLLDSVRPYETSEINKGTLVSKTIWDNSKLRAQNHHITRAVCEDERATGQSKWGDRSFGRLRRLHDKWDRVFNELL